MKHQLKTSLTKYLIAAATLLPVAKPVNAKMKRSLPSNSFPECGINFMDWSLRAGPLFVLPMKSIDEKLGKPELSGFNGGAFVEIGGAYWRRIDLTDFELHLEPYARFDFVSLNTCAYGINADKDTGLKPLESYPYERVCKFVTTANANVAMGYKGFCAESFWGFGVQTDTKKQTSPVIVLGGGISGRINDRLKIRLGYRSNICVVPTSSEKTTKKTSSEFSHSLEVGVVYVFKPDYCKQR